MAFEQLGDLMAAFGPANIAAPTMPSLLEQNWWGKFKDYSTLAGQGGSGKLEGLVAALDMMGRGLQPPGQKTGYGGLEMAQSSLASGAGKDRQDQMNQMLAKIIGGMTPGTSPGGNKVSITPNEDGSFKVGHESTLPALSEKTPQPNNFLGEDMKNFPLF